jgi:hypothetical protein
MSITVQSDLRANDEIEPSLQIEDGIPIPIRGRPASPAGTAVRALEIGQSVLIREGTMRDVCAMVSYIAKLTKRKFATRAVDGGRRVWRTK